MYGGELVGIKHRIIYQVKADNYCKYLRSEKYFQIKNLCNKQKKIYNPIYEHYNSLLSEISLEFTNSTIF